jgi:hypothetical protein
LFFFLRGLDGGLPSSRPPPSPVFTNFLQKY